MNFAQLLAPKEPPLHISCAGLIGVGKSSLANALAKRLDGILIKEPVEENSFLSEFYHELSLPDCPHPMRSAFPLQMALLSQRTTAVHEHLSSQRTLINDRSPYEDAIFVKMLQESGKMSETQAKTYMDMFNTCFSLLPEPSVIVWLKASPETCHKRIQQRNRDLESGVSLEYLQQLSAVYEEFFSTMKGRISILVINRERTTNPGTEEYEREVDEIITKIQRFCVDAKKKYYLEQ